MIARKAASAAAAAAAATNAQHQLTQNDLLNFNQQQTVHKQTTDPFDFFGKYIVSDDKNVLELL